MLLLRAAARESPAGPPPTMVTSDTSWFKLLVVLEKQRAWPARRVFAAAADVADVLLAAVAAAMRAVSIVGWCWGVF